MITKDYYEDYVLFLRATFNMTPENGPSFISNDICMNMVQLHNLRDAVSYILYSCSENILDVNISDIIESTNEMKKYVDKMEREYYALKDKIVQIEKECISIQNYNNVLDELNTKETIIESKTNIIEQLNKENKELKAYIENIYGSDEIEDEVIEETDKTIEEMVETLNQFKFCMIGGRMDLLAKLEEYNWTDIIQFDNRNIAKLSNSNIPKADFYVINTKFISHTLVAAVEKNVDFKDIMLYFNGTNTDQLIRACYDFVQKFLES